MANISQKIKPWHYVIALILVLSVAYFWQLGRLPLTAYDEAVYAQVTRDTLLSGQTATLQLGTEHWFEKPPLYFWSAMLSTKIFGATEFAYRFPGALFAIGLCLLTFFIVRKLSSSSSLAFFSALLLPITPYFYITARQVRLDMPVIFCILFSLFLAVFSWRRPKYALWVAPAIAVGILFKSVIALLAVPMIIIFSIFYRKWSLFTNKYFYLGWLLALAVVIPWHWQQNVLWGSQFWQQYLGAHVVNRFDQGYGSSVNYLGYFGQLWQYSQPWFQMFLLVVIVNIFFIFTKRWQTESKLFWSSLSCAIFIIIFFSFSKTHIPTYLLPAYPFMSITIFSALKNLWTHSSTVWRYISALVLIGAGLYSIPLASGANDFLLSKLQLPYDEQLKTIGSLAHENPANFYALDWPILPTLRFYAGQDIVDLNYPPEGQKIDLNGPFYLFLTDGSLYQYFQENGQIKAKYSNWAVKYSQNHLILLYSEQDSELP